ncbi:hypothetical protein L227DRAFT_190595 [Lentinus tigrinus ALCF2SS1-6]|uniref:DUF6533 domain-containing protein n=1 Tax=Lentinus tigrinus ALCF2SS1-6 TaxID=1328759 RepID=A0A5C2S5A7_9APHY|nr:hypothetical protein L227DRAFT_190595 [Lentinus tigrinus ALCF2SS1-6]
MSSDASDAATISLFNALYVQEYANTAVSVLFMYDALITFDREVACFWESKWTGAPLLFFANKWISMTVYVMALIVQFLSFPSDKRLSYCLLKYSAMIHDVRSCSSFGIALSVMQLVQFVPWAVFSGLRAYVLSRSKLLGLFAFALSLAPVGANMTHLAYDFVGFMYLPFGCLATDNTTTALNINGPHCSSAADIRGYFARLHHLCKA